MLATSIGSYRQLMAHYVSMLDDDAVDLVSGEHLSAVLVSDVDHPRTLQPRLSVHLHWNPLITRHRYLHRPTLHTQTHRQTQTQTHTATPHRPPAPVPAHHLSPLSSPSDTTHTDRHRHRQTDTQTHSQTERHTFIIRCTCANPTYHLLPPQGQDFALKDIVLQCLTVRRRRR